jgi:FAD synthetase
MTVQFYRFDELSLSYNGGKDCLCLLVLLLACFPDLGPAAGKAANGNTAADEPLPTHPPIQAIYIAPTDPFSEVEEFVTTSTRQYHLDLMRYELAMRPALDAYLEDRKSVKAIFMGTRRTDPHSEFLEHFSPTDKGWPQFMRINPVIDWHYVDIWNVSCDAGPRLVLQRIQRSRINETECVLTRISLFENLGYHTAASTTSDIPLSVARAIRSRIRS